ncbi:CapA family protein [Amycolatopsis sp. cg5]|uniref:CapA family protein n=1 Tax=Amycolatopsis sp. cg5 TaxID=3238802 RepID=UPI0035237ACB
MSNFAKPLTVLAALTLVGACSATTPTTAPPPSTPQPAAKAPETTFSVVATGDVLIHPALTDQAREDAKDGEFDYRPLFAGIKPVVEKADLAVCHLETPLAEKGGPYSGYPSFSAPPEVADALKDTGYDTCSTASNHTLDQGADGIKRTLDKLDETGIKHTGSARTSAEAAKPLILDVHGVKVAQISYAFGFNGIKVPEGKPWLANQIDAARIIAAAKAARAAGAEVVLVSLHWGVEYQHEVTDEQRLLAKKLLAEDSISLIIGHHAHVVQPIEQVGGKWVAYGLGNHVARHSEPKGSTEEGVAARFTFRKSADGWAVDKAEYVPTLLRLGPPLRLTDLTAGKLDDRAKQALKDTDEVVLSRGGAKAGLTRPGA